MRDLDCFEMRLCSKGELDLGPLHLCVCVCVGDWVCVCVGDWVCVCSCVCVCIDVRMIDW